MATQYAAMPSAIAGMGTEEDEDDPLVALFGLDPTAAVTPREFPEQLYSVGIVNQERRI